MDKLLNWFTDPSLLLLLSMSLVAGLTLLNWHLKGLINLSQCVVDGTTGKIAIEKVGYMTGLLTVTWGYIDLQLHDKMTEWFAGVYIGAVILGRAVNTATNAWKDAKNVPPPSNP